MTLPTINDEVRRTVELHVGDELLDLSGKHLTAVSVKQTQESPWSMKLDGGTYYLVSVDTGGSNTPALLHATKAANPQVITTPTTLDCTGPIQAELERAADRAAKAVRGS